jgi:hypothetical protein
MIFFGQVTPAGILELHHLELYGDLLKGRLANCRVQIDIDRKKTPRSQQQSAYLWAAVYGWITRDDRKSDFVILYLYENRQIVDYMASSKKYSKLFFKELTHAEDGTRPSAMQTR